MKYLFIFGCERSGTTMLASSLSKHRSVIAVPESQFLVDIGYQAADHELESEYLLSRLNSSKRFKYWGVDPVLPCDSYSPSALMCLLAQQYNHSDTEPSIVVDHTPTHRNYIYRLKDWFPSACFVHLVRDPRAVCSSFKGLKDWALQSSIGISDHWEHSISQGLLIENALGERVNRVYYEDFINDSSKVKDSIFEMFEVETPHVSDSGGFSVPLYTRSQHSLVGSEPNASRIDSWKTKLTNRQISIVETRLAQPMYFFGYKPICRPIRIAAIDRFAAGLVDFFNTILSRFYRTYRERKFR